MSQTYHELPLHRNSILWSSCISLPGLVQLRQNPLWLKYTLSSSSEPRFIETSLSTCDSEGSHADFTNLMRTFSLHRSFLRDRGGGLELYFFSPSPSPSLHKHIFLTALWGENMQSEKDV